MKLPAQDTIFYNTLKLNCGTRTLDLAFPAVMGILNVTPDSFYDGGKHTTLPSVVKQAGKMIREGADIIDIGGCSTRPNAKNITEAKELKRVIPAIKSIRKKFGNTVISIDTFRSKVAEEAVKAGANMINDISGGQFDKNMYKTVARLKVPYVLMHIKGTPQNMQKEPAYTNVTREVKNYFSERIKKIKAAGVSQIVIDPGFGFGKTVEHNYELLRNLSTFRSFNLPIIAGISRKSMINKVLNTRPEAALNGTSVANTIALLNGANILRVHDVREAREAIMIVSAALRAG